ncbi:5-formyltetrahydrofolate cyclo-ligase [bacterium]|nr:5-formyltetrahydrofolate cyclo-ligase [bacterium]
MRTKAELRKYFKTIRASLDMVLFSKELCKKLKSTDIYKNSKNILIYYPLKNEIDLRELLTSEKNFYLPRVCGQDMEVCPFKFGDKLEVSPLKICEPCSNPVSAEILDLVIVPALAVDKNNNRLGYGGGYYDRFFKNFPDVVKVVLIPKELIANELPAEEFDVKVDNVIST